MCEQNQPVAAVEVEVEAFVQRDEFELLDVRYAEAVKLLEKLNRKAVKLGSAPITLTVLEQFEREVKLPRPVAAEPAYGFYADEDGALPAGSFEGALFSELTPSVVRTFYRVKVAGEAPKFQGYRLLGVIEHQGDVPVTEPCARCQGKGTTTFYGIATPEQIAQWEAHKLTLDASTIETVENALNHPAQCAECAGKGEIVVKILPALNLLHAVPGEVIPERFRTGRPWCEHCQVKRFRKDSIIVAHADGSVVQVGRSCIKDYLGGADPKDLLWALEAFQQLLRECGEEESDERLFGGSSREREIETLFFLTHACYFARVHGWMSATLAREISERDGERDGEPQFSTASRASENINLIFQPQKDGKGRPILPERPLQVDEARAREILAWINAEGAGWVAEGGYRANLYAAARNRSVTWRNTGLVASAIAAYQKHLDRGIEKEKVESKLEVARRASAHQGEIGERIVRTLTCEKAFSRDNDYGITYIYKLADADGNRYTWFSSSPALSEGSVYELKGTVKKHEQYKGVAETHLTRCAVVRYLESQGCPDCYRRADGEPCGTCGFLPADAAQGEQVAEVAKEKTEIREGGRRLFQGVAGRRW